LQNLEERLAKRKQIIEFRKIQDQQAQDLSNNSADSYNEEMTKLVQDGQLTEKQKKELLNEYMMDLKRLNRQHDKGIISVFFNTIISLVLITLLYNPVTFLAKTIALKHSVYHIGVILICVKFRDFSIKH